MAKGPQVVARKVSDILGDRIFNVEEMMKYPDLYAPMKIGIPEFDNTFGGITLFPACYVAIGGKMKIGKTVVAVHLANVIANSKRQIGIQVPDEMGRMVTKLDEQGNPVTKPIKIVSFHLEETEYAYADRLLSSQHVSVTRQEIRELKLSKQDISELKQIKDNYASTNFYMTDKIFNINEIAEMAIFMKANTIIIDTFNLTDGGNGANQQERQSSRSEVLLRLRNDYGITIIAIHHHNDDGKDLGSRATARDADLRISVSQPEGMIVGQGMDGIIRLTTEDSRLAKGGIIADMGASFQQSKLIPLNIKTQNFGNLQETK